MEPVKLAVVGSRSFSDYERLTNVLSEYCIDAIISGGAIGADSLAERYAKEHNIKTIIYKPDWVKYGKRAGFIRNTDIINAADQIVAFWDGESKGTKNSIDTAISQHKKVRIERF